MRFSKSILLDIIDVLTRCLSESVDSICYLPMVRLERRSRLLHGKGDSRDQATADEQGDKRLRGKGSGPIHACGAVQWESTVDGVTSVSKARRVTSEGEHEM
jgi:hypothetical protein